MSNKVRLIRDTWESDGINIPKLKIGNIYTVKKYYPNYRHAQLEEGYNYKSGEGWWYNLSDFKEVTPELNSNIKIL
jgi:hypothetical protein